jgi:predicted metallo-beta-lactamase superfamily hydrolase
MDQSIHSLSYKRVDHFWREVFSHTTSNDWRKYSTVTCVLKMAWSLPHGNADVERGLLVNNSIVTKERNQLNVAVINGLKAKDAVKFYDLELMRPEKAPYD